MWHASARKSPEGNGRRSPHPPDTTKRDRDAEQNHPSKIQRSSDALDEEERLSKLRAKAEALSLVTLRPQPKPYTSRDSPWPSATNTPFGEGGTQQIQDIAFQDFTPVAGSSFDRRAPRQTSDIPWRGRDGMKEDEL